MSSEIPTIDPEKEPEYVGAHSGVTHAECQDWHGESRDEIEQCGEEATHTVVMFDGQKLMQVAMCDDCGEPEDVEGGREWSDQVVSKTEIRQGGRRS